MARARIFWSDVPGPITRRLRVLFAPGRFLCMPLHYRVAVSLSDYRSGALDRNSPPCLIEAIGDVECFFATALAVGSRELELCLLPLSC